jgi:hypothetical protein
MQAYFQIFFLVAVLLKYHFIAETSCPADLSIIGIRNSVWQKTAVKLLF